MVAVSTLAMVPWKWGTRRALGAAGEALVVSGVSDGAGAAPAVKTAAAKRITESFIIDFIRFAVVAMLVVHKRERWE
jgi:hypothetical protein